MDEFDKMILAMAERVIQSTNREIENSKVKTFMFDIGDDGFLPEGQYLFHVNNGEARVAFRKNVWETWSPPHYQSELK